MTHTKCGYWAAAVGAALFAASTMTAVAAEAPQSLTTREASSAPGNSELKALVAPAPAVGTMVLAQKGHKGGGHHGGSTVVVKKRSNKGVGIAAGIAAVTAAAILLSAKPSHAEGRRYRDSDRASKWQCRKWDDRCDDGERWACRRLRNEC